MTKVNRPTTTTPLGCDVRGSEEAKASSACMLLVATVHHESRLRTFSHRAAGPGGGRTLNLLVGEDGEA